MLRVVCLLCIVMAGCGKSSTAIPPQKINQSGQAVATQREPSELMVIYQHGPRKSVGKLVREGSEIPDGWVGGAGRKLTAEFLQRETNLAALLSDGKEGETASTGR